jgi:hypothetical protein
MSVPSISSPPAAVSVTNRLGLTPGADRVTLGSREDMTALFETKFTGQNPRTTSDRTSVQIDYGHFNLLDWRRKTTALILNPTNPWDISVDGGVSRFTADLSALTIRSFIIRGGATHLSLVLPRARGEVQILIVGGARRLSIQRPAGIPLQLTIKGGTSKLRFDGEEYGAVSGHLQTHSDAQENGIDRYDIVITGGARNVFIGATALDDVHQPPARINR